MIRVLTPREQQLAIAAADGGKHDIVDRAAERVPDRADLGESGRRMGPGPVGADGALDGEPGLRAETTCEPSQALGRADDGAGRAGGVPDRVEDAAPRRDQVGEQATPGVEHLHHAWGLSPRFPRFPGRHAGLRRGVQ